MVQAASNTVKAAAAVAHIKFIEAVKDAFVDHEMCSADPYCNNVTGPNALYPNLKGYQKIGEIVADYLKSHG